MSNSRMLALCLALAVAFPAAADTLSAPAFDVLADVGLVAMAEPADPASLYVALGQLDGIVRLVDALVLEYRADPRINGLFQHTEFGYFKARLIEDLCVRSGGPCEYRGLEMADAHSGMAIDEAGFNAFVEASRLAMHRIGLPTGTQNRLLALLARERTQVIHQ